ncbi:MAG: septum formation initiator family protein [Pseudomonadota bacterium]
MNRKSLILGLLVICVLIVSLYRAKYGAKDSAAEIAELTEQVAEAERRKAMLEADLAHMSRREWIEEYARNHLGMEPARAAQFVREAELDAAVGPPADTGVGGDARPE